MASQEELQQKLVDAFFAYRKHADALEHLNETLPSDAEPEDVLRYLRTAVTTLSHSDARLLDMLFTLAQATDLLPHDDDLDHVTVDGQRVDASGSSRKTR